MQIISLNCEYGRRQQELLRFVEEERKRTDVFCLQEVSFRKGELAEGLRGLLVDYKNFFLKDEKYADGNLGMGIWVRNGIAAKMVQSGRLLWHWAEEDGRGVADSAMAQVVEVVVGSRRRVIVNFHGMWGPGDKLDSSERIRQSEEILNIAKRVGEENVVLIGDFNLSPSTRSIEILSERLDNLNTRFGAMDTRGRGNDKYWGTDKYQPWADYAFVGKAVRPISFEARDIVISDHKPLILEIED